MAAPAIFTPEEWSRVLASPMVASAAITLADPSGLWGLLKEGMAGSWALVEAKQNTSTSPLVRAVAEAFTDGDARTSAQGHVQAVFRGSEVAQLKSRAVEELRSVATILDTKAPADAAAFKSWLQGVAQRAAEAASEGGFLGFGGVAVSESEKTTLAEISAALNTPAAAS
jgi:hypothetical protein